MPSTKNLRLSMTPQSTNKSFLDWRLEQDGTENSNMQKLDAAYGDMQAKVDGAIAMVGKPTVAETAADMTDQTRAYVYVGDETGYTYGNWYYYDENDTQWKSGGVYQASAVEVDETLRIQGVAADAKAAGELVAINETPMDGTKISVTTTTEDVELATMDDVDELKTQFESDYNVQGYPDQINASNYAEKLPDLNNAEPNRIYIINQCLQSIANIPSDTSVITATLMTFTRASYSNKTWYIQFLIGNGNVFYYRSCWGGVWSAWKYTVSQADINTSIETDTNKGASKIQDFFVSTCVRKDLTKGISASSKIITIGDSITAGSPSDGYYTWVAPFCDYLGCTATNKAVGGACFGESNPEVPQSKWISTQIATVTATEWAECDFVFVAAGTNDARYIASYDEIAEKVSADLAAIHTALSANGNTTAHIIFITPTRRNTKNNEINLRLPEISGIIENIALTNGCSVICGFDFPIPTDNVIGEEDTVIAKLTSDNLHPNLTGSKVYAQSVINAIM